MLTEKNSDFETTKSFRREIIRELLLVGTKKLRDVPLSSKSVPVKMHKPHIPVDEQTEYTKHIPVKTENGLCRRCALCSKKKMCIDCDGYAKNAMCDYACKQQGILVFKNIMQSRYIS